EPGGETVVDVTVKDAAGRAVAGSELAVIVVDEAILGLTGYRIGDPLATFYAQRGTDTSDYDSRKNVLLANPDDLLSSIKNLPINGRQFERLQMIGGISRDSAAMPAAAPMAKRAGKYEGFLSRGPEPEPIRTRENFDAL